MISPTRSGTLEDLPEIAKLHGECFADAWSVEFLGRLLAQPGAFSLIAMEGRRLVGFVIARANAGEAEILSLGVRPSSRRQGFAAALVRSAMERAIVSGALEIFLEVSVENVAALALYGRLGFREVGRRSGYYQGPSGPVADALVLRHSLPD